jgi:thiamine-monophosphate kinase
MAEPAVAPGVGASGEDSLIARYFRPLAMAAGAFNLMDDAATLPASDEDIVVTTDAIVEGVHFLADDPPDTIARKALRVNLSDLAAKGAVPTGFVLTLALREANDAWLSPFARALGEDATAFGCALLGGDTVSTPGPLMISITAFGRVPRDAIIRRTGAKVGDRLFVTGTIGDAALGLNVLRGGSAAVALPDAALHDILIARYRVPEPRNAIAKAIRLYASAALDVSDGLAGDLAKLCAASGVSARVAVDAVPLSAAGRAVLASSAITIETILAGGDDYEVLCAVPENRSQEFVAAAAECGIAVADIGVVVEGHGLPAFVDAQEKEISLPRLSYSHF